MERGDRLTIFALLEFQSLSGLEDSRWKRETWKGDRPRVPSGRGEGRLLQPSVDVFLCLEREDLRVPGS